MSSSLEGCREMPLLPSLLHDSLRNDALTVAIKLLNKKIRLQQLAVVCAQRMDAGAYGIFSKGRKAVELVFGNKHEVWRFDYFLRDGVLGYWVKDFNPQNATTQKRSMIVIMLVPVLYVTNVFEVHQACVYVTDAHDFDFWCHSYAPVTRVHCQAIKSNV